MKTSYFRNKRVLITGITGFVGSHLARTLTKEGAKVIGISRSKSKNGIIQLNVGNYKKLEEIVQSEKIQVCYHLAGESLVEEGQKQPYQTYKDNIIGALNILELSRLYGVERVIIASSSHVYGKNRVPYHEEYTPKPSRPYETSKACIDLIATSYANNFNLPVLIPRFVNIYGPGDLNFSRIIPESMKGIIENKRVSLWNGKTKRDYLYVDDAVEAYLKLTTVDLSKIGTNRIFNFGAGKPISVSDLLDKVIDISGEQVKVIKTEDKRLAEISSQYVSLRKSIQLLNWKATVSLDEGLEKTYSWYKNNL